MKYVIIGRTATGKTHLADMLAKNGLSVLKTTTTRPQRSSDDTACHFITPAEAAQIPAEQKILYTNRAGIEYFTNMDDLNAADVCVIDPAGFKELITLLPKESLHVVYALCTDSVTQKQVAVDRADDPIAETVIFNQRQADEDAMFSQWEKDLAAKTTFGMTSLSMHRFENDYKPETAEALLRYLVQYAKMFNNMKTIVCQCADAGILNVNKPGFINVTFSEPTTHVEMLPIEHFVDITLSNHLNTSELIRAWLALDLTIPAPTEVIEAELNGVETHDDEFLDVHEAEALAEIYADPLADADHHDEDFTG